MDQKTDCLISIVIPVKNGSKTLNQCLHSIFKQENLRISEVIVLDSNSSDDSIEIATSYGARVIHVNSAEFNHGLTRNLGVKYAFGDLVYFTVQDAALSDVNHLEKMISHFNDEEVQAVVGIQGYEHEKNINPALWFKRFDEPVLETRYYPNNGFEVLSANEQFELSNWDNVNAMYRKSALLELPFVETNYCEDWIWANQALTAGKKLLRDPSILVYHYHHMTFGYTLKSKFIINYYFYLFFKQSPRIPSSLCPFLRRTYTLFVRRKELSIQKRLFWLAHNVMYFLANFLSLFLFRLFLVIGKKRGLDFLYQLLCNEIPQGKTNRNNK
jgi:rhamnosyltransferase